MLTTDWHGVLLKASNHVQFLPLKSTWNVTVGIPAWEGRPGGSGSRPGAGMSRAHCCSWRGRATWSLSVDEMMAEQQAPGPGRAPLLRPCVCTRGYQSHPQRPAWGRCTDPAGVLGGLMPAPCLPWASDPPGACGREEGRQWARGVGGGPSQPGWKALGRLAPGLLLTVCCYYLPWTWTWISLLLSSAPLSHWGGESAFLASIMERDMGAPGVHGLPRGPGALSPM